jgi:hypothetical protein
MQGGNCCFKKRIKKRIKKGNWKLIERVFPSCRYGLTITDLGAGCKTGFTHVKFLWVPPGCGLNTRVWVGNWALFLFWI